MIAYRVDPRTRVISRIMYSGVPAELLQHCPYQRLDFIKLNVYGDNAAICQIGSSEHNEDTQGHFRLNGYAVVGVAVVFGTDYYKGNRDPFLTLPELARDISWGYRGSAAVA